MMLYHFVDCAMLNQMNILVWSRNDFTTVGRLDLGSFFGLIVSQRDGVSATVIS